MEVMTMIIEMNIKDLEIEYDLSKRAVKNNIKTIQVHFKFDGMWDDLITRVVTFTNVPSDGTSKKVISVDYTDEYVDIPVEVLEHTGKLYISVWGTNYSQSKIARTEKMCVPLKVVEQGEDPGTSTPSEDTATTFDKMYKLYNELITLKSELITLRDQLS